MAGYGSTRGTVKTATIGDVELLVETVPVTTVGSQPTSGRADKVVEDVSDAFDKGQAAITAIATKLGHTVADLTARGVRPDQVQVEFGLSFSATGNVIVAGSTVEASLKVTITYDRDKQAGGAK